MKKLLLVLGVLATSAVAMAETVEVKANIGLPISVGAEVKSEIKENVEVGYGGAVGYVGVDGLGLSANVVTGKVYGVAKYNFVNNGDFKVYGRGELGVGATYVTGTSSFGGVQPVASLGVGAQFDRVTVELGGGYLNAGLTVGYILK